jgi:hypothetical protein
LSKRIIRGRRKRRKRKRKTRERGRERRKGHTSGSQILIDPSAPPNHSKLSTLLSITPSFPSKTVPSFRSALRNKSK